MEQHKSTSTQSGSGSATYIISHGCPIRPFYVSVIGVSPSSVLNAHDNAPIPFSYNWDDTDITITYLVGAPDTGTDNLTWAWMAECS